MNRREMFRTAGAAMIGLSSFPFGPIAAAKEENGALKQKILLFTRSPIWEHPWIVREKSGQSKIEKIFSELGQKAGFEVVCTKDGAVFDGDLGPYSLIAFYATGNLLTDKCDTPQPGSPMSPGGKKRLLAAIEAGKGFVGIHPATTCFMSDKIDPFVAMIGAEFIMHQQPQKATMKVTSPKFPGMEGLGDKFTLFEEWYAHRKFAKDLHVILVQETAGMEGDLYKRPPYPATWARMHGKGRVFYTSMGHQEIWNNKLFQQVLLGGIAWASHHIDADITPNIAQVAPKANQEKS
jgi:uncharacterized protein